MDNPVEEIKNRLDIADVIQEYVRLTRAGANYKALCPFHNEKTPSFMVSSDKQIFHCFGCGEGGDVFAFIKKMEGVEFPEALRLLAQKAGVKLKPRDPKTENQKTKLLDINRLTAAYFNKILLESSRADGARQYLKERNVTETTIDEFQLGYSIDDWDDLFNFLVKKGYRENEIFDAGLTVKKDRGVGYYDRFRGRLMFPLADAHGQIVGFSGRQLKTNEEKPSAKYVNTPQTLVYNKSAVLYALDKAKRSIQKEKFAIVVEGQMDAIASHQIGVTNVVASGGTALTQDQVRILKRYCGSIIFAFDMDTAGAEAARRGLEIAWQNELETKVIKLPVGKDPDECIQKEPKAWPQAIKNAQLFMDYYFSKVESEVDLRTVPGKKSLAKKILPLITRLPDAIEQNHYLKMLSSKVGVEEKYLRDRIAKSINEDYRQPQPSAAQPVSPKDRAERLSELIIGIVMKYPEHLGYIVENIKPEYLKGETSRQLYKKLVVYYTESTDFSLKQFYSALAEKTPNLVEVAKSLCLFIETDFADLTNEDPNIIKKTLIDAVPFLKNNFLSQESKRLEKELQQAEATGDKDHIRSLSENITRLTEEIVQNIN